MSTARSLSASSSTTFLVYATGTVLSLLPAWPIDAGARSVGGRLPNGPAGLTAPGGSYLVEAVMPFLERYGVSLMVGSAAALALGLLLSPWLQMAWLIAIDRGLGARTALRKAGRLYLRCLGLRLALGTGFLLLLALSLGASLAVASIFHDAPNVRRLDLGTTLPLLLGTLAALPLACLWDLAHGRLARGDAAPLHALKLALRAIRLRTLLTFLGYTGGSLSLLVVANALALALPADADASVYVALGATQLTLLVRAFLRAAWLREALARTST